MTESSETRSPGSAPVPVSSVCPEPRLCSLAQAAAGASLRVRELNAPADVAIRLRELGFCEQQRIRLLSKHTNVICQVCNVRLGISRDLAGMIMVEAAGPGPNGKEHPRT